VDSQVPSREVNRFGFTQVRHKVDETPEQVEHPLEQAEQTLTSV
jgi:hypothetical protein